MVRRLALIIGLTLLFVSNAWAEIPVDEAAARIGARFLWEPYRRTGMLTTMDHVFVFKPDLGWGIFDYSKILPPGNISISEDGAITFSAEIVEELMLMFETGKEGRPIVSTIIIDPGHGGKDPGAVGKITEEEDYTILMEKDVVLQTCLHLYSLLSSRYPGKNIILTRSDDTYLRLEERTELANSIRLEPNEAMIFISVHANASFNTKASGYEVWYLPPEYRRELLDPEELEDVEEDVIPILNTMLEEEYTVESIILARSILKGLDTQLGDYTENRGLKEETWFVVRNARMPSVLIEMGFVTNQEEAKYLSNPEYLKKAGMGIYNGIYEFIDAFERTSGFTE